jgi:hypothetical protein
VESFHTRELTQKNVRLPLVLRTIEQQCAAYRTKCVIFFFFSLGCSPFRLTYVPSPSPKVFLCSGVLLAATAESVWMSSHHLFYENGFFRLCVLLRFVLRTFRVFTNAFLLGTVQSSAVLTGVSVAGIVRFCTHVQQSRFAVYCIRELRCYHHRHHCCCYSCYHI